MNGLLFLCKQAVTMSGSNVQLETRELKESLASDLSEKTFKAHLNP